MEQSTHVITKPLLAATVEDLEQLKFPLIVTPKIDGIRCLKLNGTVVSRNLKPIPNRHIRKVLTEILPDGADGEIIVGRTFQECSSGVMSHDGEPEFTYHMFDYVKDSLTKPYIDRLADMYDWYNASDVTVAQYVRIVPSEWVKDKEELVAYEIKMLELGNEGVMLRHADGPYKCGRSTIKAQTLMKLKKFADSEAEILGFEEQMHNENAAETNALGHTERSSCKAGMVPAGTLGALKVRDVHTGVEFNLGTGFLQDQRKEIWDNQAKYLGKIAKYKYFEIGVKEAPRFPVYLGIRDPADML